MTQNEKLLWLIKYLLAENQKYNNIEIPNDRSKRFDLYRSLVNVRMPEPISKEYVAIEDEFLNEETNKKTAT